MDKDDLQIARDSVLYTGETSSEAVCLRDWLDRSHSLLTTTRAALKRFEETDIDPAVWDSILVTATAVSRIVDTFLRPLAKNHEAPHYPVDIRQFHLRSMPDFRRSEEWCPNERKVLEQLTNGQLEEIAFFSQLNRSDGKSHIHCTALECVAHHVDGTYTTVHYTVNCTQETCSMIEYSSAVEDEVKSQDAPTPASQQTARTATSYFDVKGMANSLYEGVQQVVDEFTKTAEALTFVDGQLHAVRIPFTKSKISSSMGIPLQGWTLVAFSHVWSDGLGNRDRNALPSCQLQRLQGLANGLYPQRYHTVPFRIDTLMIPIVPSGLAEKEKEAADLRKKAALRNMEWVYKGASKVLVLESTLFPLDTAGMSPEERGARIITSIWSRRLWTEGCMKDRTFFQFRDGAISWPELHSQALQAASVSDWRKKHSVLPKKHPIRQLQKIPHVKYNGSSTQFVGGSFNTQVDISSPMHQAKSKLDKLLFKALNPVWSIVRSFLEDMSLEWSGG